MEREWGNEEEMERKWGNGERLTLYISSFSLYFLPLSPFPPSLSISYIKMHHILLQNVKYGTFVANVTKISTYALWGNNSGSNLLRGSSAIRAGLLPNMSFFLNLKKKKFSSIVTQKHLRRAPSFRRTLFREGQFASSSDQQLFNSSQELHFYHRKNGSKGISYSDQHLGHSFA